MTPGKGVVGWGLVGCGDIAAKRVAAALSQTAGSALVAVARARAAARAEFAERHGARRWHADWRGVWDDEVVAGDGDLRLHAAGGAAAAGWEWHAGAADRALDRAPAARAAASGIVPLPRDRAAGRPRVRPEDRQPGWRWSRPSSPSTRGPIPARLADAPPRRAAGLSDFGCHRIEVLLDPGPWPRSTDSPTTTGTRARVGPSAQLKGAAAVHARRFRAARHAGDLGTQARFSTAPRRDRQPPRRRPSTGITGRSSRTSLPHCATTARLRESRPRGVLRRSRACRLA